MGWGKEWKTSPVWPQPKQDETIFIKYVPYIGEELTPKERKEMVEQDWSFIEEACAVDPKVWNNLKPTHDPYTNPKATIYYECGCGEILDPQTKSFAALNNYASEKGWKIRFGADGYTPYCVKCGEDVE